MSVFPGRQIRVLLEGRVVARPDRDPGARLVRRAEDEARDAEPASCSAISASSRATAFA